MNRPKRDGLSILTDPLTLQRLEGGVLLVLSVLIYWKLAGPWLWYIVLILAPDLFMLGYLGGARLGAAIYNLGHTWLLPGILAAVGVIGGSSFAVDVAVIWIGHIGGDRLLGYGLKLPTGFQDTHLGRIGRSR
jgi:Domain of unknown function (DUF4260)